MDKIVYIKKRQKDGSEAVTAYKTVAARVQEFRAKYPIEEGWGIVTSVLHNLQDRVVVRADIVKYGADGPLTLATGTSEEKRGDSMINTTSALENAETSAIGRALAAAGFIGDQYASADEIRKALSQVAHLTGAQPVSEKAENPTPPKRAAKGDQVTADKKTVAFFQAIDKTLQELKDLIGSKSAETLYRGRLRSWGYETRADVPPEKRRDVYNNLQNAVSVLKQYTPEERLELVFREDGTFEEEK